MFPSRKLASYVVALMAFLAMMPLKSAAGTWKALSTAPPVSVNEALVLSDGSILTDNGSGQCARLTPDIHGSYINGTWTQLSSMNYSRLFFSTEMLTNGTVFVAGGEDGNGSDHGEIFDPLRNTWTRIYPDPIPAVSFSDAISETLPDCNVLEAPVTEFGGCLIYNVASNTWQTAASAQENQDEACWVKLANDNILTIDSGSENAEHYVPSLNEWISDNSVPVELYDSLEELGPGFLLPNGNVFYFGATTNTAIYTPGSTATSAGTWTVGPAMVFGTNLLGMVDAPAAMLTDGNILCALGPVGGYNSPTFFYEYNYVTNSFTQEGAPGGSTTLGDPPFANSMLDLPDGNVLFVAGQNTTSLYVYTPSGTPLAAGQPAIDSITENVDGSYELTGTTLTGISEGATYGDDEQMKSNYPLVRMTNNATGNVYYARTFDWNCTSVQTGSRVITTEFTLPQNLPPGTYSLAVEANGNPSAPTTFNYAPPTMPGGLTCASGSNSFVNLKWNASASATAYNVKRSSTVTGYYSTLATVGGLSFTNTGLTNGLTYYYKVAAIGSGGPSSDSAAATATPAGPALIPGATQVNLSAYYNRSGIFTDGRTFATGFDGGSWAFSSTLLGTSLWWNNLVFIFGPSNANDVVYGSGQTINLPSGQFNTLQILASGVNGSQTSQTFTVTYTDNSTATFTQNLSDWANSQSYPGEFTVMTMPYRDANNGGQQTLNMSVYGYVFVLNETKTVKSITLPNNSDVVLMAMMLANDSAQVSLTPYCNRAGIYADGTTFTNPATGGLDGAGDAYSATLTGNSLTWSNSLFAFGPFNAMNMISCASQAISLPSGNYAQLQMLATAVNGGQGSQKFTVTYTDSSQTVFSQSLSDWFSPANFSGESKALIMSYRNLSKGTEDNRTFYLYGYSFALNPVKTVQSISLPSDTNVIVTAISLVPEWHMVVTAPPILPQISQQSGSLMLNWSGGVPPYQLQMATNLSNPNWQDVGGPVGGTNVLITPSNSAAFYRIVGQ